MLCRACSEGAGVVVDGFPRTMVQAQVIKLLHDKMHLVRAEYKDHPKLKDLFRYLPRILLPRGHAAHRPPGNWGGRGC